MQRIALGLAALLVTGTVAFAAGPAKTMDTAAGKVWAAAGITWAAAGDRLMPAKPADNKAIESGRRTEDRWPRRAVSGYG